MFVEETDGGYIVYVSVPGVDKKDISIKKYKDGRVVVRAENNKFSYRRMFWLDDGYDIDKVVYNNGMLEICVRPVSDFVEDIQIF